MVPHAEMGQGVHTTLAMMLADEMDAAWDTVVVLEAPAEADYANDSFRTGNSVGHISFPVFDVGLTEGIHKGTGRSSATQITGDSSSVRFTGQLLMRVAGASAKAALLQAAADAWGVATGTLRTESSHLIHEATRRRAPFAALAAGVVGLSKPPVPVLKSSGQFTLMGKSLPRLDVPGKVDGSAVFGIDTTLPGMKYAAIRAAPVFGAMVARIDGATIDGAVGIRKVMNLGEAVAVVADSYWHAQQALNRLAVEWTASGHERLDQGAIFRQFSRELDTATARGALQSDLEVGDTAGAFAAAQRVIAAEYRLPYLAHATMEPPNCTAWVHDGRCELWLGTQNPLAFRSRVAKAIDFDPSRVVIHNQYLGGGFGRRSVSDYAEQAARIAAEVTYPVKLIWSREEDIRHDHYRQASINRLSASVDSAGWPTGWRSDYVEKHFPVTAPHIPYRIENQSVRFIKSETPVPWGFWRSVDCSIHTFAIESFIDELAVAAGTDPFGYRHRLLAGDARAVSVLERVANDSDWGKPLPKHFGRGIAIYRGFGSIVALVIEAEVVEGSVRVDRVIGVVDAGFAIHPDGLKAQMEGGIIFGLTAALYGDISIRGGGVVQSNFHDYRMLRMSEAPDIHVHVINGGNGLGGAGETAVPVVAPALTNAVFDATGRRIRELPVSKHRITR